MSDTQLDIKGWGVCCHVYVIDWCTLKNMCGPLEYAQPPYFYLPSVGVVTTDVLSKGKPRLDLAKESLGPSIDSTNDK